MAEQPFDPRAYSVAYQIAIASGVGHTTAYQHATIVAHRAADNEAVYLAARFAGCTEPDASAASLTDRDSR